MTFKPSSEKVLSISDKNNLIALYYSDKSNLDNKPDVKLYLENKITEQLKDYHFVLFLLNKANDNLKAKNFLELSINEYYAFMASLKVDAKALEINKLIGFLSDFKDVIIDHHYDNHQVIGQFVTSYSNILLNTYKDNLIKKPYFSSISTIYKNLLSINYAIETYKLKDKKIKQSI